MNAMLTKVTLVLSPSKKALWMKRVIILKTSTLKSLKVKESEESVSSSKCMS